MTLDDLLFTHFLYRCFPLYTQKLVYPDIFLVRKQGVRGY